MKQKFLLILLACSLNTFMAKATQWGVTVSNFQFTPSSFNVTVGDTINWSWVEGGHTTTSGTIPGAAATWSHAMNSSSTAFQYVVTVAGVYNYYCIPHQSFMMATFTASSVLPVSLLNFGVTKATAKGSSLIKWSTASEENTDWFVVKKSVDGSVYTEAARIKAAGNSSIIRNYSFTDNTGTAYRYVYYELQILNKDGSSTLSPVKKFINESAVKKLITMINPNPVSAGEHLMIQFNADRTGNLKAALYDMSGKLLMQTNLHAEAGINNGHLHLMNIQPGFYNVVFTMDDNKEAYKIVIK